MKKIPAKHIGDCLDYTYYLTLLDLAHREIKDMKKKGRPAGSAKIFYILHGIALLFP